MTTPEQIAEIAKGLTKAQRNSITGDPWKADVWGNFGLIAAGVLDYRPRWWLFG